MLSRLSEHRDETNKIGYSPIYSGPLDGYTCRKSRILRNRFDRAGFDEK